MHGAIYTRVSTLDQAEEGLSLDTQREAGEALARELGASSVEVLEDAFTGTSLDRPAMNRLRDMVRARQVDLIVVYDPDRFSRDLSDLLIVTREIERAGVRLEFVNFDWQRTPQGMLFLQIRGAFAQFEHAQIRERTLRGKRKKAELGGFDHHMRPYGYDYTPGRGLSVSPRAADVVRRVFRLYAEEDLSVWDIARRLADEGVPGPRRPTWDVSTLHYILRNPVYATGQVRRQAAGQDWLPVTAPPLVDAALFDRVQTLLSERARRRPRRHASAEYLLQGLLTCGRCGARLHIHSYHRDAGGRIRRYTYYRCPNRSRRPPFGGRTAPCDGPFVASARLDAAVWDRIAQVLRDPELYLARLTEHTDGSDLEARAQAARSSAQRLTDALRRVEDAYFMGDIDRDRYRDSRARFERRAAEARDEARRLEQQVQAAKLRDAEAAGLRELAERYAAGVADLPFATRRQIVVQLVSGITLSGDEVVIRGRIPITATVGDRAGG